MSEARDVTEFKLVYDQAAALAKDTPEAQFKTVGALLVIVGWLVTADTAQSFIRLHRSVTLPATVMAMTLFVLFKALWIGARHVRARDLHARLLVLASAKQIAPETVDAYRPSILVAATFFLVNVLAFGAIVVCVALACA